MVIRRFDLDHQGLERVLGELEAKILEAVWDLGQPTVREVTAALGSTTHHKTVMTVMNRMVVKGLLARHDGPHGSVYTAMMDRERFAQEVAHSVLAGLLADFGRPTLAQFLDDTSPDQLAELEQLIAERKQQREDT